jgi:UDP-N-acetylmuramate-alanine ligase
MLGLYQAENITGGFAMAVSIGINPTVAIEAISKFKGLKRRMEKRYEGDITIIDDIAHSPEKARSVINTLRSVYSGKIIVIFEPNIGGRSHESKAKYDNAFNDADIVIIPRLTKLKVAENTDQQPMEGDELCATISKTHKNAIYLDDDTKLVDYIKSIAQKDDIIAFLGSHGFRGMIEETMKKIQK